MKGQPAFWEKGWLFTPGDLISELATIQDNGNIKINIIIDEMTPLSLDTHRAFESSLKKRERKADPGSTGRGLLLHMQTLSTVIL